MSTDAIRRMLIDRYGFDPGPEAVRAIEDQLGLETVADEEMVD